MLGAKARQRNSTMVEDLRRTLPGVEHARHDESIHEAGRWRQSGRPIARAPAVKPVHVPWIAWAAVAWFGLPALWGQLVASPYPIAGLRGLQDGWNGLPLLAVMSCWAIVVSLPGTRTRTMIAAGGGCCVGIGMLYSIHDVFAHTGGPLLCVLGFLLLAAADGKQQS